MQRLWKYTLLISCYCQIFILRDSSVLADYHDNCLYQPACLTIIAILYLSLLFTYTIFVNLQPQSSFAQTTTNTTQTSTEVKKSQPKALSTPCKLTEPTAQGPEYKAGPPFKQGQDFAKGLQGQRLELSGKVLNAATCKPVQGAVLDLWQTNSSGDYDYKGFNLRGKIVTDKDG
jgi:Dioxygenase